MSVERSAHRARVLLIGPPGSGKGTQGARLASTLGVRHIAAGDVLRCEVKSGTPLGRTVSDYLRRGDLVPDDVITDAFVPPVTAAALRGGYVLDGFPRTIAQAHSLDDVAAELDLPLQAAVYLDVGEDELQRRLLARARAEGRDDDAPDVIARRLKVYIEVTRPLVDFYTARGIALTVNGRGPLERIAAEIIDGLSTGAV